MKKRFKKNRLKIFIALSLMITCLFGVMFATNTFAYNENYATISNTLDTDTLIAGQNNLQTSIKSNNGTNNQIYSFIEVQHNTTSSIFMSFGINLKSGLNYNNDSGNYIALINLEYGYYNTSTNAWTTFTGSSYYVTTYVGNNVGNTNYGTQTRTLYYSQNEYGYNYKSTIIQLYNNNSAINFNNTIYFNFRLPQTTSNTNYYIRVYNIDIVPNNEIYTQDYIDTYYAPLEEQYNQLLEDYEELETDYTQLNNDYTQLESDYNTLETNYNELQNDYNDLTNTDTNGLWAYFSGFSIGYIDSNNAWQTLEAYQTFEDFKNSQYNYLNGISINLSNLKTRYPNYDKLSFAVQANTNGTPLLLNALSYKINNDGNKCQNGIVLESYANTIQLDYTNLIQMQFKINYQNINDNIGYYDENKRVSILLFSFEYDNSNNFEIISLNNEYNNGYSVGFQKGRESLNYHINSLNERINNLVNQVNTQQQTINALNEQIEAFNSDYNLNNLMWTIGSTPFESFKQIWNVNFFGVNLADFFLGFVTFFIALFVVKKFFL